MLSDGAFHEKVWRALSKTGASPVSTPGRALSKTGASPVSTLAGLYQRRGPAPSLHWQGFIKDGGQPRLYTWQAPASQKCRGGAGAPSLTLYPAINAGGINMPRQT